MKLPQFLFNRVKTHNTSLGENGAFPPEEDYPFDYKVLKKRYNDVIENAQRKGYPLKSEDVISLLSKVMTEYKKIEDTEKETVIQFCKKFVCDTFNIPSETIILECDLVDVISSEHKFRLMPEESEYRDFDFSDLKEFDKVQKVILKRRLINSLIQGAAYSLTKNIALLKKYDEKMALVVDKVLDLNDLLLFLKEEEISDKHPSQGGYVEVILGRDGEKTEIKSQGLIFPYLLMETFRGFLELFASHGLPQDNKKAQYIINQADFLFAEPWDLRFGVPLWNLLLKPLDVVKTEVIPYFFMLLCEMPVEDFNDYLREVFAQTTKGKQFILGLYNQAIEEYEYNDFQNLMKMKNDDENLLNDDYLSADDLDGMVIEEDGEEMPNINSNNDRIKQLLIQCSWQDIDFDEREMTDKFYNEILVINGTAIPTSYVKFWSEDVFVNGQYNSQVHIQIREDLRRNGIAYKVYRAFIHFNGYACSLFKNRTATFYSEHNATNQDDAAIGNLWQKLSQEVKVTPLYDENGNQIGVEATE